MFLNKVLSNSRHILSRGALPVKTAQDVVRQKHTRAVPPRTPLQNGEKIILGVVVFATVWFTPYWILYHIPDYQKEDRHTYTGK